MARRPTTPHSILAPRLNRYTALGGTPTIPQLAFLMSWHDELFYGGAAGGGKSWVLLGGALQYVDVPGYAALILRKNIPDLKQPGGLIHKAHEWLGQSDAEWNEQDKRYVFPVGSSVTFGHMDNPNEIKRYRGGEYHYIGIDEVTDFSEAEYRFMFSRLRRSVTSNIPLRMRAASNPDGPGFEWVKARFVNPGADDRPFIPARLEDNPHIDRDTYTQSLMHLDPVLRAKLMRGDWEIQSGGSFFRRQWFPVVESMPRLAQKRVRYWDLAASVGEAACHTSGVRASWAGGVVTIEHVVRGKWTSGERDEVIAQTAAMDGGDSVVWVEQEPGSGGKAQVDYLVRKLAGYAVHPDKVTGDKVSRAAPFASYAEAGNVRLVRGVWNEAFLDELNGFDPASKDFKKLPKDQVDSAAGAFSKLTVPVARVSWL